MALVLRLGSRSRRRSKGIVLFFSTNSNSPFSFVLNEIKDHLKQSSPPPQTPRVPPFAFPLTPNHVSPTRSTKSTDEINKILHEFRPRTTASPQQQIAFQKLYQDNININSILHSLQNIKSTAQTTQTLLRPIPFSSSFGKEVTRDGSPASPSSSSFLRNYSVEELGEKLKMFRPVGTRKDWFSVRELSERLGMMRKMEEEEQKQAHSNTQYGFNKTVLDHVRGYLAPLDQIQTEAAKKASRQGLSILSHLSGTPTFSPDPPKPHLVQKYFHPDNMSSTEKLKIELAKVRDEFKMSDSDCGSARVQIAQLTTKIKYLSAVLPKKDVHFRKGLIAMVQRRKRLLKYLRRTDWDSYCFVISKLELRDNPDHVYKTRSGVAA